MINVESKIEVDSFIFERIPSGEVIVTYSDGSKIDLSKIKVINVGIQYIDDQYAVTLITKEAIQKLKLNITDDLSIVGFHFSNLENAHIVWRFCVNYILNKEP